MMKEESMESFDKKRSVFNAEFIKDATDFNEHSSTSEQVQATVQRLC